jgi:ribonuclease P protein component
MPSKGPDRIGPAAAGSGDVGRLRKRAEFLKVAGARVKWATPGLILQARRRPVEEAPGADAGQVRVGFTVSRKVGNAVRRNRARRRLRAVVREVLPACGQAGTDYVVIGRRATTERPFAELSEDLRAALRRLGQARAGQAGTQGRRGSDDGEPG